MDIILSVLAIVVLAFILNILIIQSNNFIFMVFNKPSLWIVFMGLLSFIHFFIGSNFKNSFNIVWLSALLAFIVNIPPKGQRGDAITKQENKQMVDKIYNDMGIKRGRLKYRVGMIGYLIGGGLGWLLFYSERIMIK